MPRIASSTSPAPACSMWCRGAFRPSAPATASASASSGSPARIRSRSCTRSCPPRHAWNPPSAAILRPVAVLAEVLGHRADEPDEPLAPVAVAPAHVARGAPATKAVRRERDARLLEPPTHLGERDDLAARERHLLDEPGERVAIPRVAHEVPYLVLVHAGHHDRVDLERAEPSRGGVDPFEDAIEPRRLSGDAAEPLGRERVERHVERAEPRRACSGSTSSASRWPFVVIATSSMPGVARGVADDRRRRPCAASARRR